LIIHPLLPLPFVGSAVVCVLKTFLNYFVAVDADAIPCAFPGSQRRDHKKEGQLSYGRRSP